MAALESKAGRALGPLVQGEAELIGALAQVSLRDGKEVGSQETNLFCSRLGTMKMVQRYQGRVETTK